MRVRLAFPLLGAAALLFISVVSTPVSASPPGELAPGAHPAANVQASDRVVYQYDRGQSAANAARQRPGSSPNMTWHGGPVLSSQTTTGAIFWGPTWATAPGDKIDGIDTWYRGFGGSNYAKTTVEYTDGAQQHVSPATTYVGHQVDPSTASGGSNTSAILAEVAKVITNPVAHGYYAVYTDLPRGHAKFCAWHSSGTIGAQAIPVEFAFFWKLDGDPGCDPADTSGLHSQGLAAIANVSGHELAEAMTDPASPGAWYDAQGSENGDKCAWTFGAPLVGFTNGSQWKIQGEWSNAGYLSGSGVYANSSGQKGCLGGA
jgi:hypothetical protein